MPRTPHPLLSAAVSAVLLGALAAPAAPAAAVPTPGVAELRATGARAAAAFVPDDPGRGTIPGGWQRDQWNFTGPHGVDASRAWGNLVDAGRPGGLGVVVAVLDTGVAYRDAGGARRSPDLARSTFVAGRDFVDDDAFPDDRGAGRRSGHGTHIASTIAEATNNGLGMTGLAYGARIMPVRVLAQDGLGDVGDIARGIRFATANGADVINLSVDFNPLLKAKDIPDVLSALRYAHAQGVVVVGVSGNRKAQEVALPARAKHVIAVGATTEHGCLSAFSNTGKELDLVAPGGGSDRDLPDDPRCDPTDDQLRDVFQVTLDGRRKDRFGIPNGYEGTSMAAPHVAATAALIIASGVIGVDPSPEAVEARLEATARDLGSRGVDRRYGAGLVDAGQATRRGRATRRPAEPAPPSF